MSTHSPQISLILGGARAGKTRLAEERASKSGLKLVYLATATAEDNEMQQRISRHRQDRDTSGKQWQTVEEPIDIGAKILEYAQPGYCLVVDCLTLWLSNCLHQQCWKIQQEALIAALAKYRDLEPNQGSAAGKIILISNETGLGVVPMGQLSRKFVDESGLLHQQVAQLAHQVTLVIAGLPTELKHEPPITNV